LLRRSGLSVEITPVEPQPIDTAKWVSRSDFIEFDIIRAGGGGGQPNEAEIIWRSLLKGSTTVSNAYSSGYSRYFLSGHGERIKLFEQFEDNGELLLSVEGAEKLAKLIANREASVDNIASKRADTLLDFVRYRRQASDVQKLKEAS
jgi:hypothetical protein